MTNVNLHVWLISYLGQLLAWSLQRWHWPGAFQSCSANILEDMSAIFQLPGVYRPQHFTWPIPTAPLHTNPSKIRSHIDRRNTLPQTDKYGQFLNYWQGNKKIPVCLPLACHYAAAVAVLSAAVQSAGAAGIGICFIRLPLSGRDWPDVVRLFSLVFIDGVDGSRLEKCSINATFKIWSSILVLWCWC